MSELYLSNRIEELIDENSELVEELRRKDDYIAWLEAKVDELEEKLGERK